MNLARFSVNRPVTASIISVAIFTIGLYSIGKIPVSLYPEVTIPYVSVTIPLPGGSVEQMEKKIVKPLEKELTSARGQKRIITVIRRSLATIIIAFEMGTDQREAIDTVREKVAKLRAIFPKDTKEPIVTRIDLGASPVLIFGIESLNKPAQIKKVLDDTIIKELQTTYGVGEAEVVGIGEELVEINLDPYKLSNLRIAPLDVYQQLSAYTTTIPWGNISKDNLEFSVSRKAISESPEFWNNYMITLSDGRSVRVGEIGSTRIINDSETASVRINGKPGLSLVITKRADANTLETVKRVKQVINKMDTSKGIKLFSMIDQSEHIEANTKEVWISLFIGGAFAVLSILLFLTDVKSAIITATALPVSVAGTFIFINYFGFSINMMSLLALSLSIGLVIDDAVVVRESIFSQIEEGKSPKEAAILGTDKVASAVLATTLAVIAVFLPISGMTGIVGQFFKEFGVTIIIAVSLSLWVAFTLDPMLSAKFSGKHRPLSGKFWDGWRAVINDLEVLASELAGKAYRRPTLVLTIAVLLLALSIGLTVMRGADFLTVEDRGSIIVSIKAPAGSTKAVSLSLVDKAYTRLADLKGLADVYARVNSSDPSRSEMRLVFVSKSKRKSSLKSIANAVNARLKDVPAEIIVDFPPFIEGVGQEAQLTGFLYGENLDDLFKEAERILPEMKKIKGIRDIYIETGKSTKGYDVEINQADMRFYGTNATAVELTGRIALTGLEAGNVGEENKPLFIRYPENMRNIEELWRSTYIPTLKGPVLMSELASLKEDTVPTTIAREKRSRKVVFRGALDFTRSYSNIMVDMVKVLKTVKQPISYDFTGDKEFFDEMVKSFSLAFAGSTFFIFIILAIQFENTLRPFVIILTLPLALIGAFLALYFSGNILSLGALIGTIFLIGLASKNGILLVDAVGVREKVMPLEQAVRESTMERFRPIIMTSITMVFGMIPTAVMRGAGSETRAPMAIAIIGGVITSTLFSLVIVPAIFGIIGAYREKNGKNTYLDKGDKDKIDAQDSKLKSVANILIILIMSGTACSLPLKAEEQLNYRMANMKEVISLLKTEPREGSKEKLLIKASSESADGLTESSYLAFAGGIKLEAERQKSDPGVVKSTTVTLPLPPQLGGPVSQNFELTIVPKEQDTYTIGWTVPIFNMQAIRSLDVAEKSREQEKAVKLLQKETFSRTKAGLLLQYELALRAAEMQREHLSVAQTRLNTVTSKVNAGLARSANQKEAEASKASAEADYERAKTEVERLRVAFYAQSGQQLPKDGFGLPEFPIAASLPFNPMAIKVLKKIPEIHSASAKVSDAAFIPTLDLTVAKQTRKYEPDPPDPQTITALKLSWMLLDGGTRRRNVSQALSSMYQAESEAAGMELELRTAYDTLKTRIAGAKYNLAARRAAMNAAAQAVNDAVSALNSGAGKLLDVRLADQARLTAGVGVYQALLELQAIAIESMILSGCFLDYLEKGKLP
ncbi:MAG: efflux RND transporter permease subunit [Oligoflexales bacterium]|nr:efflux RND transporter permease subunit [Oligoflexales bacterium]